MKSSKYISILCMGGLLSLASCTDGFESDNKINGSFDDIVKEYDFQKYTTNYNPQNEMFRLLGTKRSFSQNETFFFSHPYPPTLPFSA